MFAAHKTAAPASSKTYIEDVFSTHTYTGNGSTQTVTNGIDLAGKGGLAWIKSRSVARSNFLADTARGATKYLSTDSTSAEGTDSTRITSFGSSGFTLGASSNVNNSAETYTSGTFRKAPKFFDVVTFTYTSGAKTFNHSLGSSPGMVIIKKTDGAENWWVYHRSTGGDYYLTLNQTAAQSNSPGIWTANATDFTVINGVLTPGSYVAYLFAHDTSADGLIQCGSFTADNYSNGPAVNLGWEPQFLLVKNATNGAAGWITIDNMRGFTADGNDSTLAPNSSAAEVAQTGYYKPTATGFVGGTAGSGGSTHTFIYIAIRRGPMRQPTSGTQVYQAIAHSGTSASKELTSGFPVDLVINKERGSTVGTEGHLFADRLRGANLELESATTDAEVTRAGSVSFDSMTGAKYGTSGTWNFSGATYIAHLLRRYPGAFDIVCDTGTGVAKTVPHNLGVAPELMIRKSRTSGVNNWNVYHAALGATQVVFLDLTSATATAPRWNDTAPTASVFSVGSHAQVNNSGDNFVTYLFATLAGISKVFNYVGDGTTGRTIDCGFAAGARFILIKNADAVTDWFIFDTVRGIVAGADPFLKPNNTSAEASSDEIDPVAAGFAVNAFFNVSGNRYIGFAFA